MLRLSIARLFYLIARFTMVRFTILKFAIGIVIIAGFTTSRFTIFKVSMIVLEVAMDASTLTKIPTLGFKVRLTSWRMFGVI